MWVWDHINIPYGVGDPWVMLSAVAAATKKIKLVIGVVPLPRYRPHLLSRLTASLDILSEGRLIFGAGIGGMAEEYEVYDEDGDAMDRAEKTDEGLDLLTKFWTGEPVIHTGKYFTVREARQIPGPVQKPRIPIWIGGDSPAALRRVVRWDGWITSAVDENCQVTKTPEKLAEMVAYTQQNRKADTPFEVAVDGVTQSDERRRVDEYTAAGVTWYFESLFGLRGGVQ